MGREVAGVTELASFGWRGGRDGYLDMCDEWQPGSTWAFTRTLQESPPKRWSEHPFPRVELKLRIFGHGQPCRAYRWTATVELGEVRHDAAAGKCRSVREAQRDAKRISTLGDTVLEVLRIAYSPLRAKCIYRLQDDEWVPWLTFFGIDWSVGCMDWPSGDYLGREWCGIRERLATWHMQRGNWGYTCRSSPDLPEVESWLPRPAAQEAA